MLRAVYHAHSGIFSRQKFFCYKTDFFFNISCLFAVSQGLSLSSLSSILLSNICPIFLNFYQHKNGKKNTHYLYSDSLLYNSSSIIVPPHFFGQGLRNVQFFYLYNKFHSVYLCCGNVFSLAAASALEINTNKQKEPKNLYGSQTKSSFGEMHEIFTFLERIFFTPLLRAFPVLRRGDSLVTKTQK